MPRPRKIAPRRSARRSAPRNSSAAQKKSLKIIASISGGAASGAASSGTGNAHATQQFGAQAGDGGRAAIFAVLVPLAAIMGAVLFVLFVLALLSLIATQTIFGWMLPLALPLWAGILLLIAVYAFTSAIVRGFRYAGGGPGRGHHPGWAALHSIIWIGCTLLLFWVAYMFVPGVREVIDQLTWAANLTLENISATIV
jgi:hypothetical protein